ISPTAASQADPKTTFQGLAQGTYTVQLVAVGSNGQRSPPVTRDVSVAACGWHPPSILSVTPTDVTAGAATSMPPVGHQVRLTAFATDVDSTCPGGDPLQ